MRARVLSRHVNADAVQRSPRELAGPAVGLAGIPVALFAGLIEFVPDLMGRLALLAFPVLGFGVAARGIVRSESVHDRPAWCALAAALTLLVAVAVTVNAAPPEPARGLEQMGCDRVSVLPAAAGAAVRGLGDPYPGVPLALAAVGGAFAIPRRTRLPGAWTVAVALAAFPAYAIGHLVSGCPSL